MKQQTITINGVVYDHQTGLPLRQERGSIVHHTAQQVHRTMQKSQTLNRRYLAKPAAPAAAKTTVPVTHAVSRPASAHAITKFAPHPKGNVAETPRIISDFGPAPAAHPVAARAQAKHAASRQHTAAPAAIKPSQVLKNEAIADATERTVTTSHKKDVRAPKRQKRFSRALSVASASLGLLLLGGYLTYLSMPNISTRGAAAQAGIDASYPSYKPSGYSLAGPVAFQEGSVSMKFASAAAPVDYTLTQSRSGWDSTAVLDNYVAPKAGREYTTTAANGLTIYTFGQDAAWVSGGILYTISGNAPLSIDQIKRIATSV